MKTAGKVGEREVEKGDVEERGKGGGDGGMGR